VTEWSIVGSDFRASVHGSGVLDIIGCIKTSNYNSDVVINERGVNVGVVVETTKVREAFERKGASVSWEAPHNNGSSTSSDGAIRVPH